MSNNKTATACPPTGELQQLLGAGLSGDQQQDLTSHLDRCECCQAKLEELATGGTNLSSVVQHMTESEPMATSAYWPALQAVDAAVHQAGVPKSPAGAAVATPRPRSREAKLDFLEPASDPSYLGRLAHFDVMRVLGRGGMGVVLEAFDSKLQRNVAIKVLDQEYAEDEVGKQRFCREARAAASVTHENVVAVHQVERSGDHGIAFLVMQLISGETLEQKLAREKILPPKEIVRIGMEAARGLAAAHALGLIHRDIKPGNILLEPPHDRVKLTDFGLARIAEDVKLTRTGFVSGTPLYMAPEQALGGEPDPRSDLFSLGAILYEMATGQTPFTGGSALAILKQITEVKHKPAREVNPAVPEWLSETIDDLLAKKPADRYQTASDLAEVLEYHWAHLKTSSDELPGVCQIEIRQRRFRTRLTIAVVGAALLTLGLFSGSLIRGMFGGASVPAVVAPVSSAEPIAVLSANAGPVWAVSFDPTSKTLAMATEDGSVRFWDLPTKTVKSTLDAHNGLVWNAQYAHDGQFLATSGDDSLLKIWKLGQPKPLLEIKTEAAIRGLAISRDGKFLYAGGRDGSLFKYSTTSTEPLATARQSKSIFAVAITPDGQTLATGGADKTIHLWDAQTLTQKLPLEGHAGQVYGLSFDKDGHKLASAGWDKKIRIWDVRTGLLLQSWDGNSGDLWDIAYSPDGTKLATAGQDGSVRLWQATDGKLLATYLGHKATVHTVAFVNDGSMLVSGGRDGSADVWPVK
ncbi:WD40 repeat domain-containing serine/threonine protein kinase [Anatilimnocola sp. NA78]|uniref:WD40 repeat domain-containing serine/threonine protein kinase n=1 Tax=Anatilimnocola sp. NA78 TaxID=3415683 RepID=UPI003CE4826C